MRRVLPAPLLSASILGLWLLLDHSFTVSAILFGFVLAVLVPLFTAPLRPLPVRVRHPLIVIRLILTVGKDVIVSNLVVGWGVLVSGRRPPNGRFVTVPLDLRTPHALAALSTITTVIPGTVWSELAVDRSSLLLHVWDIGPESEEVFVTYFKARYEQPLRRIFEEE